MKEAVAQMQAIPINGLQGTRQRFLNAAMRIYLEYCEEQIPKLYGNKSASVEITEVYICLPQTWPADAMVPFAQACRKYGIKKVFMAREADAVVAREMRRRDSPLKRQQYGLGDKIIVCDGGGATVDYATLEVIQLQPLTFKTISDDSAVLGCQLVEEIIMRRFLDEARDELKNWSGRSAISVMYELQKAIEMRKTNDGSLSGWAEEIGFGAPPGEEYSSAPYSVECGETEIDLAFKILADCNVDVMHQQIRQAQVTGARLARVLFRGGLFQSWRFNLHFRSGLRRALGCDDAQLDSLFFDMNPYFQVTDVAKGGVLHGKMFNNKDGNAFDLVADKDWDFNEDKVEDTAVHQSVVDELAARFTEALSVLKSQRSDAMDEDEDL